jgi:hypothetical protein
MAMTDGIDLEALAAATSVAPELPPDTSALVCPDCGRTDFKNERGLKKHITQIHVNGGGGTDKAPRVPRGAKQTDLAPRLAQLLGMMGMAWMMVDQQCGTVALKQAEPIAKALDHLSQQNESVRKVLEGITKTGPYAELTAAAGPLVLAVLIHHTRLIPPGLAAMTGLVPTPNVVQGPWQTPINTEV